MVEQRMTDVAFRTKAVELMKAQANVTQLARDLGVSRWALYRWKQIYEKQGPAGLALRAPKRPLLGRAKAAYQRLDETAEAKIQIAELERKVGRQALQIDFLSKAFTRVRESRRTSSATGGTASTERSEP